jgi:hypothetical protein
MITFFVVCNEFLLQRKHSKPNHSHLFIPVNKSLPVHMSYHDTFYPFVMGVSLKCYSSDKRMHVAALGTSYLLTCDIS